MQTVGLFTALPGYDGSGVSGRVHFFSYNETFELSAHKNVTVFVMDRLDVRYMREQLRESPQLREQLDGFTFYENNISTHTNTFPAMTYMLTGQAYDYDEKWTDYWDRAWAERNFIDILRENGYRSMLLLDKPTTYGNIDQIVYRTDNAVKLYDSEVETNYARILMTTLDISMSKVVPYYLKNVFISTYDSGFSNNFFRIDDDKVRDLSLAYPAVTNETDLIFLEKLSEIGLSASDEFKTFSFVHLNCAHSRSANRLSATQDAFDAVIEYIHQMKELGIYDDSTFIIVADHGRPPIEIEQGKEELESHITSALLIKPPDSRGDLKFNSTAQLSHTDFAASVLQAAGLPHEEFGLSYFDVIEGDIDRTRTLYINRWRGLGTIWQMGKYEIVGDANNFNNWTFIPPED
jgi:hypothetical protein